MTSPTPCCLIICLPLAEPNQKRRDMGTRRSVEVSFLVQKLRWRKIKGNREGANRILSTQGFLLVDL